MTLADEITAAAKNMRRWTGPAAEPIANWLDSWTGIVLREDAALPEDARHALAVARAINGSTPS